VKFIQGNCQDAEVIAQLGDTRFDAILHIAGQSSGEISFDDPAYDLRTNTESTLRLIKFGLANGCRRFIYASSMSVYGDVPEIPIAETREPRPLSFYGVGKLASEHYMRIYQSKGLQPTALRFFNVYGPLQNMKNLRQGMVSIFLAQLIKHDKVVVKGALDRFRDFIFIDDVVGRTVSIIDKPETYGGVFNIASGVKTTVGELLDLMKKQSGIDKEIVIAAGTPGDQKGIQADVSLARRTFGFEAQWTLARGLAEMVRWAKSATW
jgi:UDP-glucose 4-epimerase